MFVAGLCNPRFNTLLGSRDMVFSLIKQNYFYVNASGVDQGATIPTLWEWMDAFAANTELKLIILDLKIVDIDLADYLVSHIMTKAVALSAQSKIRIVSSDYSMAAALQTSLSRAGYDINIASRVFGGTAGAVHLGSNENFNAVEDAQTECYGLANVGQTVSSNGWRQYQNIVSKMVTKRDEAVFYKIMSKYSWGLIKNGLTKCMNKEMRLVSHSVTYSFLKKAMFIILFMPLPW